MKHLKIFETYKSQKEIEKLTNRILKAIGEETYRVTKPLWDMNEKDPQLRSVFHNLIGLREIKKYVNLDDYDELKEFIEHFPLEIKLHRTNIRGDKNIKGSFTSISPLYGHGGKINLRYSNDVITKLIEQRNDHIDKDYGWSASEIYIQIYYEFGDTLLHELQHAYDDFRSNGKYAEDKKSTTHYKDQERMVKLKQKHRSGNKLTPKEIKKLNDNYLRYHRLQHEVDARFTQAIQKVHFYGSDWDIVKNEEGEEGMLVTYKMKPFKTVLGGFKAYFEGWYTMTEKIQRRLLHKVGKFYIMANDDLAAKNEKSKKDTYDDV